MKNKFQSPLLLSALVITLLAFSNSFAKQTQFTSAQDFYKHHPDLPGGLVGGDQAGIAASVDGEHYVAVASDAEDIGYSCYSSDVDPVSNMSHGWKKRATFIGANFYGITFEDNNFIITGMKNFNAPIIITSKDNGTSWVERNALVHSVAQFDDHGQNPVMVDSFEFNINNVLGFLGSFYNAPRVFFVAIGSDYFNDNDIVSIFSLETNKERTSNFAPIGSEDFIAIGSEDFTPNAFVPSGSDDDSIALSWENYWNFKAQQPQNKHHHFRSHKNGAVYWNL